MAKIISRGPKKWLFVCLASVVPRLGDTSLLAESQNSKNKPPLSPLSPRDPPFHSTFYTMMSTVYTTLQVIANTDDDNEDTYILLGCKLVIAASGLIGAQCHCNIRQQQPALYCLLRLVIDIYRGLGETYFWCAYQMHYKSFWHLHEKLEHDIKSARF